LATFEEHISQAKSNLSFLIHANSLDTPNRFWDWQVTICFYTALHTVNAHIAKVANLHYRTHEDVRDALNPLKPLSLTKVDESIYLAYTKLEGLSRRSRYLCNEKTYDPTNANLTYDKHLARAVRHLDALLKYFSDLYNIDFGKSKIKCPSMKTSETLHMFQGQPS
jgi:hypothetical protein